MYTATKGKVLPTTMAGSLPRPAWFNRNLAGQPLRAAMVDSLHREQYLDAVSSFIRDQERAGLDIVSDGDARFDNDVGGRSWVSYVMERLDGVSDYHSAQYKYPRRNSQAMGSLLYEVHNSRVLPIVMEKIGPGHIELTQLWRCAQQMTSRPVKIGMVSPEQVGRMIPNVYYEDKAELIGVLCDIMNAEFHGLAAAGATVFQVEEPWVHRLDFQSSNIEAEAQESIGFFNRSVRGLRDKLELWVHTSWGNPAQQRGGGFEESYEPALAYMNELEADVLTFECASTGGMDLSSIAEHITGPKIGIGVINARTLEVERPEDVASLIRKALEVIPAERLCITTDTGFGREGMGRRHAFYKMVALARGTNIVRRELGVPETYVPAADPMFAIVDEE
ncbi:MAG: hypothetical protein HOC91_10510 [Nitrospinaceae bacterium]|nr:hypothetical protein [Nitrospinaceae bacterium]MBT3433441.1 hypothetical protein [Nitrospinaceae bacterium]MBT3820159.1 hypothetical protein [Nitrospinaceae bacterium]MBT4092465.1 hypothetical protein [Nitrospinaceae bacterium]MBT4430936.1 hypothetical protein [Nitrospinaceae bacterium]